MGISSICWRAWHRLIVVCVVAAFVVGWGSVVDAQQFRQDKVTLDKDADKAKKDAMGAAFKAESLDMTPYKDYYLGKLFPQMTDPTGNLIVEARREIERHIDGMIKAKNGAMRDAYNAMMVELLPAWILRQADKPLQYSPATRINAFLLLNRLTDKVVGGRNIPDPRALKVISKALNATEIDAVQFMALRAVENHMKIKPQSEEAKKNDERIRLSLVNSIKGMISAEPPFAPTAEPSMPRGMEAHHKMMEQVLIALTTIATTSDPKSESCKIANESATELIKTILFDYRYSEWIKETACWSLGSIQPANLSPEDITKLQNEVGRFAIKFLKEWREKIARSGSFGSGMGMGGYAGGMGSGMGYPGGSGGDGYGSEGGSAGLGGSNSAGYGSEGAGYGMGMGMQTNPNAASRQPPEVKNARRMGHQRLERLHIALDGQAPTLPQIELRLKALKGPTPVVNPEPAKPPKGLLALVGDADKAKIIDAAEKLEKLQKDVSDEKIVDLNSLSAIMRASLREFRLACVEISGDKRDENVDDTDGATDPFGNGKKSGGE
ncbi:MAG: hypothetical protein KGQ60_04290 [Planctomycetes bacterium]|nr:hypothetical protein [Planctomycetota bacterium]